MREHSVRRERGREGGGEGEGGGGEGRGGEGGRRGRGEREGSIEAGWRTRTKGIK